MFVVLLLTETLLLYILHVRLDLGRPMIIFIGVSLLTLWLVGDEKKDLQDAFKKGSDFLAAGRLEPAFAEFRRCRPFRDDRHFDVQTVAGVRAASETGTR